MFCTEDGEGVRVRRKEVDKVADGAAGRVVPGEDKEPDLPDRECFEGRLERGRVAR